MNGGSNDYIFETIIENYDKIKIGDVVSINKTFHQRFDAEDKRTKTLRPVHGELPSISNDESWKEWVKIFCDNQEQVETIINYTLYFAQSELHKERQDKRFDFVKNRLTEKGIKVIMWRTDDLIYKNEYQKIYEHTRNKILDGHFSFKGHRDFSKYLLKLLKYDGKTIL